MDKVSLVLFGQRQYTTFQQMLAGLINDGEKVLVCIIAIQIFSLRIIKHQFNPNSDKSI